MDGEYIHTGEIESALSMMTFLTKAWIPLGPVFRLPPFHGWSSLSNPWVPLLSPLGLEIIEYHPGNLFTPSHNPPITAGWVGFGLDAMLHCSYLIVRVHFLSNTYCISGGMCCVHISRSMREMCGFLEHMASHWCGWTKSPAVSVNKRCCSHLAISHNSWWSNYVPWGDSVEKNRIQL